MDKANWTSSWSLVGARISLFSLRKAGGPYRLVAGRAADALAGYPQQVNYGDSAILALAQDSEYAASAQLSPRIELAGPAQLQIPFRPDWARWLMWDCLSCRRIAGRIYGRQPSSAA